MSPKIELAGVETGEKTLVEPKDGTGDPEEAAVTGVAKATRICIARFTLDSIELWNGIRLFPASLSGAISGTSFANQAGRRDTFIRPVQ
jgi:hypothetical protein